MRWAPRSSIVLEVGVFCCGGSFESVRMFIFPTKQNAPPQYMLSTPMGACMCLQAEASLCRPPHAVGTDLHNAVKSVTEASLPLETAFIFDRRFVRNSERCSYRDSCTYERILYEGCSVGSSSPAQRTGHLRNLEI